ncbi:MAG TPA: threonine synthase, partial [Eggerthellaceae bacterium]|nr:threonine synthase [Eggerthellaceae bacterium]
FKDMALQMLPYLLTASLAKTGEKKTVCILVATSGDTGKAALEGFRDVPQSEILVFYPEDGVSPMQKRQMITQEGENVAVCAVRGNFDDAQTGVKRIFGDSALAARAESEGFFFSSANSINWGRLAPQIVYYISAYCDLLKENEIFPGDVVNVCVPTGNFGNILAAWYAKQMGAPIERLICASNENRVLTDFINTGTYDISERTFVKTPSPSMDILVSSNLERQLFELTGRDARAIAGWMADLKESRRFKVDRDTFGKMRELYAADSVNNAECLATIREVFEQCGCLMDPHTAVAHRVAQNLREDGVPVVVASTAHWAKFGNNVYRALHGIALDEALPADVAALTGCELNRLIAEETGASHIPAGLAELDDLPILFTEVIDGTADAIRDAVCAFLGARK